MILDLFRFLYRFGFRTILLIISGSLGFSTYFFCIYYSALSVFVFYLLEAIGRSGAELLTRLHGGIQRFYCSGSAT